MSAIAGGTRRTEANSWVDGLHTSLSGSTMNNESTYPDGPVGTLGSELCKEELFHSVRRYMHLSKFNT